MNYGWIKIHRGIRDNWVSQRDDYFSAWIKLLMEVNHSPTKTFIGGEFVECNRGESLNSIKTWVRLFSGEWTQSKVRTFFAHLEKDEMIECTKVHGVTTKLAVNGYEEYQSKESKTEVEVDEPKPKKESTQPKKDNSSKTIKTSSGGEITPTDIIERWNKLADKEGLKKTKTNNQGVKKKISTRMGSYKTIDEWNDLFKAVKEQARHLKTEGWFKLDWVVKTDENFDKVLDRWMSWKDREFEKKDKFNDSIDVQDEIDKWGDYDEDDI